MVRQAVWKYAAEASAVHAGAWLQGGMGELQKARKCAGITWVQRFQVRKSMTALALECSQKGEPGVL